MSVLKVGALKSPSSSSNNIVLNADGTISTGDGGTFVSNNYYEAFKVQGPTITSIHPSANVAPGDTVYIVGTGFDRSANVMLVSNSNVDVVVPRGNITFNNSANVTFVVPGGYEQPRYTDEDYDVRITIDNTGLAAVQLDALDFTNPSIFQGSYLGYTSGGGTSPSARVATIDKFPFASDDNAVGVGDLTLNRRHGSGQSSTVSGYTSGGNNPATPTTIFDNTIDKFPFTTDSNATDVGDLFDPGFGSAGQSSSVSGYASGGDGFNLVIQKFPFATDSNSTDVGDLTVSRRYVAGQTSSVSGYTSGGNPTSNVIDKFPFASDTNATDVGDLTVARDDLAGQSSDVSGYTSGGGPALKDTIDKFPFATDANATDVGNLVSAINNPVGQSSTRSGYTSGGSTPAIINRIDKFPFSTDANATDVGDLTVARENPAGQQV